MLATAMLDSTTSDLKSSGHSKSFSAGSQTPRAHGRAGMERDGAQTSWPGVTEGQAKGEDGTLAGCGFWSW